MAPIYFRWYMIELFVVRSVRIRLVSWLIPALGKQQVDLCKFKDNLVYQVNSRIDRATREDHVYKT